MTRDTLFLTIICDLAHIHAQHLAQECAPRWKVFDDIFDRNWELAILIQEQYEAVAGPLEVTSEQARRFRARSRRIAELLESAARELPNWDEELVSDGSISEN